MKRDKTVAVRVTAAELAKLKKEAAANDVSMGHVLRRALKTCKTK